MTRPCSTLLIAVLCATACGGPARPTSHAVDPDDDDVHWAKERPRAAAGEPSDSPRSVRFGAAVPAIGTIVERHLRAVYDLDGAVFVDGDEIELTEERHMRSRISLEVLATEGAEVSELRATFHEVRDWSSLADADAEERSPLEGRVVIATRNGGQVTVRADDGRALDAADRDDIAGEIESILGDWSPDEMPPLPLGETTRLPDDVAGIFDSPTTILLAPLTVKVQSIDVRDGRDVASLVVHAKLRMSPRPQAVVETDAEARAIVDLATGWPIELAMSGPTTIDKRQRQGGRAIRIRGSGESRATSTYTYSVWPE